MITTTARRPSPWLAMSRAALSRASWRAVEPKGVTSSSPLRMRVAVAGEGDDAPVAAVEAGQRHLVLRAEGVQDLAGRHPRAGDLQLLVHAPARVHQEQDAGRQARARREKWAIVWGRPSSKIRNSSRRRSLTGRPLPSTAVAENTTRSLRAEKESTCPGAEAGRAASATTTSDLLQQAL